MARQNKLAVAAVASELQRRGVDAQYWLTGGGIMVARIEDHARNLEWTFDCEGGTWGCGFATLEPWEPRDRGEQYVGLTVDTPVTRVADVIQARLQAPPPDLNKWAYASVAVMDGADGIEFRAVESRLGSQGR